MLFVISWEGIVYQTVLKYKWQITRFSRCCLNSKGVIIVTVFIIYIYYHFSYNSFLIITFYYEQCDHLIISGNILPFIILKGSNEEFAIFPLENIDPIL